MPEFIGLHWINLKPEVASSPIPDEVKELGKELLRRPGLLGQYLGRTKGHTSLEIISVWDSEESYKADLVSYKGSKGEALVSKVADLSDPARQPRHNLIKLEGHPFANIAAAPTVHVVTQLLPADVDFAAFVKAWDESFAAASEPGRPEALLAGGHGWAVDLIENHPKLAPGQKGKLFLAVTGWTGEDAHQSVVEKLKSKFAKLAEFGGHRDEHYLEIKKIE